MRETDGTNDSAAQEDSTAGDVGDVEAAGETTAAVAISGPTDTRPVGADTLAKVAYKPDSAESNDE